MKRFLVVLIVLCSLVLPALAEWNVPNFQQDIGDWADEHLGDCTSNSFLIRHQGCAVTSTSSVFAYYGLTIDGQYVDSLVLHNALKRNDNAGYSYNSDCGCKCYLDFDKAAHLVDAIFDVSYTGTWPSALHNIEKYLADGPVIARIHNKGHFVVVTDKIGDNRYSVMDPLYSAFELDEVSFTNADTLRIFTIGNPPEPQLFSDVRNDHWAVEFIGEMKSREIMDGLNGKFYPYNNITRGEICTMIVRSRNLPWNPSYTNPFTDLDENNSHYRSILICYHLGYVSGIGNQFFPDNPVLRRDAAKMICNGFEISLWNILLNIWRDYSIGDDNYEYAYTLCREGILSGYPDHNFGPNNNLTRAEAAKIFSNAMLLE